MSYYTYWNICWCFCDYLLVYYRNICVIVTVHSDLLLELYICLYIVAVCYWNICLCLCDVLNFFGKIVLSNQVKNFVLCSNICTEPCCLCVHNGIKWWWDFIVCRVLLHAVLGVLVFNFYQSCGFSYRYVLKLQNILFMIDFIATLTRFLMRTQWTSWMIIICWQNPFILWQIFYVYITWLWADIFSTNAP